MVKIHFQDSSWVKRPFNDRDMNKKTNPPYILGHTENELKRLSVQAQYWGEISLEVLQKAEITSGMRVLDIGCGAGDLSFLAANLVGSSGSVLGIDRSHQAVKRASNRAKELKIKNIDFLVSDIEKIDPSLKFDAVIGRFVLMFQADPTTILRSLVKRIESGGVLAFIEVDMSVVRSVPVVAKVEKVLGWATETFKRAGIPLDLGPQLWYMFKDIGIKEPNLVVCQRLDPGTSKEGTDWLAELVKSLLPMMEKFGVVTAEEVGVETLAEELHRALLEGRGALFPSCLIGTYSRIA